MSVLLINDYLREIDRLRQYSGAFTEKVISEAFKDLLKTWAKSAKLHFIPQHDYLTAMGNRVVPDGAVLHDLRVPLGWWEAKDTADDLDTEIARKFRRGYPQDNLDT
ncbi:MAG: DNA methyltransferase, partial [Rhodobacteraceae bacterium]|nr:DNA methyltransferase [Paracoccaceae bacterium]